MLGKIGNIVHTDVIISQDEANNKVMRTWGTPSTIVADGSECGKLRHHEIMQCLGILEMERGSRVAGHRGYYLKGLGVMLNQAL
jgi:seryl-tRNA synthetase